MSRDRYVGHLVSIHDIEGSIVAFNPRGTAEWPQEADLPHLGGEVAQSIDVNGAMGRCLAWHDEIKKYVIHLVSDLFVYIPERNMEVVPPTDARDGGFDLLWPSLDESLPIFTSAVNAALSQKGWCMIKTIERDDTPSLACAQAQTLVFLSPRADLMPDLLGRQGRGKIAFLERDQSTLASDNSMSRVDTLTGLDSDLTALSEELADLPPDELGFTAIGRRKAMVWMPCANDGESAKLPVWPGPSGLSELSLLEGHLKFIRQRKLCIMRWINNEGGTFTLTPRPGLSGLTQSCLPITQGRLIVFRCDWMSFSYAPIGNNALALTTWILEEPPQLALSSLINCEDPKVRADMLGLKDGTLPPVAWKGEHMEIRAAHARVPGGAIGFNEFSTMVSAGTDAFTTIPLVRFDLQKYCTPDGEHAPGKSYVIHGSFLADSDVQIFDNEFFGIVEDEAQQMAPAQRLILENGYATLRKAGLSKSSLTGKHIGVVVGDTGTDWSPFLNMGLNIQPSYGTGTLNNPKPYGSISASPFIISGVQGACTASRLSHCLGLRGVSAAVDTACSASLVGVVTAVHRMREASTGNLIKPVHDAFLCMGISTLMSEIGYIALCGPSMLSRKGRCFTFDKGAEGYARGDGFGAVYVHPKHGYDHGDFGLAQLIGCFVNQDGKSATLTAPNGAAQKACVLESMREAGVAPSDITLAECHGTGTALGDPIEVNALRGVMEQRLTPLLSTSAKSNVGHLEACAGITGLLKCIAMLITSACTPNVHLRSLNPHLDIQGFPAYFTTEATDTCANSDYAGVSSFGFSGTNARADVWATCQRGPRSVQPPDPQLCERKYVRCPVTMGLIHPVSGEPLAISDEGVVAAPPVFIRDEWADYDVSRYAYTGEYRNAAEISPEVEDEEPPLGTQIHICFPANRQEMEHTGGGWFVASLAIGDCCYEVFSLCIEKNGTKQDVYPAIDLADQHIAVEGPGVNSQQKHWLIDGRDTEASSGSIYKISFRVHSRRPMMKWCLCSSGLGSRSLHPVHSYALLGSWTSWCFRELTQDDTDRGLWTGCFKIGSTGSEEFQIARDGSHKQIIYPAKGKATKSSVPIRGPDAFGARKTWLVQGSAGDEVKLSLRVSLGHFRLEMKTSKSSRTMTWESLTKWNRRDYYVRGSFNSWCFAPLVMDTDVPGLFRFQGETIQAEEYFQIVIDEDLQSTFYPQVSGAGSSEVIVLGPDSDANDRYWCLRSTKPGARFEIVLDMNALDRRRIVSWRWL